MTTADSIVDQFFAKKISGVHDEGADRMSAINIIITALLCAAVCRTLVAPTNSAERRLGGYAYHRTGFVLTVLYLLPVLWNCRV